MKGNDVVNKVLANVLEEEVSCDVDLHEAIEDQDFEVRGTCGWCGRLQINLTLGSSMRVVEENRVESYKARAWNYCGSKSTGVFWYNYPSRKMMQLIMRKHWKLWVVGNRVDHCNLNIQKKIVAAQTACVWRIGIGRDVLVLLANFTIKFYKGCLRCSAVALAWGSWAGKRKTNGRSLLRFM